MVETTGGADIALVTGATRGIGAAIARALAAAGNTVVGTATTDEGAAKIAAALAAASCEQALDTLMTAVHRHTGGHGHDDMALLLLEHGASPRSSANGHLAEVPAKTPAVRKDPAASR